MQWIDSILCQIITVEFLGDMYVNVMRLKRGSTSCSVVASNFIINYTHIYKHMNKTVSHNIIQNCGELAWHFNSEKYL